MKKKILFALCGTTLLITILICAYLSGQKSAKLKEVTENTPQISETTDSNAQSSAEPKADSQDMQKEAKASAAPTASPVPTPSPSPTPSFTIDRWTEEKTMYAISSVNVRKGPSTDYALCGYLNGSDAVTVKGTADTGWYLITMGDEDGFVSNKYLSDTLPTPAPAPTAQQPAVPAQAAPQTPAQPAQAAVPAPTPAPAKVTASTIFVGDSRFVQMHEAVGETGVTWIHENGKGYDWFVEKAIPRIDNLVGDGTKILINLGVNDPEHYNSYITMVNSKAAEWTQQGAIVYYASVNPVWENPYTTEDEVITFNEKVSAGLTGVYWIDSHTYLNENGYRILDGLHYSAETSAVIYNYYITCIQ